MNPVLKEGTAPRSYVVSLENRKRRGSGHERPAEILKAARELFLEHGVENVTTRQIAGRVGISQTALYVYFDSKEQMLDKLAENAWSAAGAAMQAVDRSGESASAKVEGLRVLLGAFMRFWIAHPDDYRIVFMRKALRRCDQGADVVAQDSGLKLLAKLTEGVREAVEAQGLRCLGSNEATALSIWAAVSGLVSLRLGFPELPWPPADDHVEAMLDLIFNGCIDRTAPAPARAV